MHIYVGFGPFCFVAVCDSPMENATNYLMACNYPLIVWITKDYLLTNYYSSAIIIIMTNTNATIFIVVYHPTYKCILFLNYLITKC